MLRCKQRDVHLSWDRGIASQYVWKCLTDRLVAGRQSVASGVWVARQYSSFPPFTERPVYPCRGKGHNQLTQTITWSFQAAQCCSGVHRNDVFHSVQGRIGCKEESPV